MGAGGPQGHAHSVEICALAALGPLTYDGHVQRVVAKSPREQADGGRASLDRQLVDGDPSALEAARGAAKDLGAGAAGRIGIHTRSLTAHLRQAACRPGESPIHTPRHGTIQTCEGQKPLN